MIVIAESRPVANRRSSSRWDGLLSVTRCLGACIEEAPKGSDRGGVDEREASRVDDEVVDAVSCQRVQDGAERADSRRVDLADDGDASDRAVDGRGDRERSAERVGHAAELPAAPSR